MRLNRSGYRSSSWPMPPPNREGPPTMPLPPPIPLEPPPRSERASSRRISRGARTGSERSSEAARCPSSWRADRGWCPRTHSLRACGNRCAPERRFVGFDPEMIISYRAGVLRSNGETIKTDRPIAALRSILEKHDASGIPGRYVGGLVGYVSYEFVRNLDSVPAHADSPFPEFEFGLYLDGGIVDHVLLRAEEFRHGRSRVEDLPKA